MFGQLMGKMKKKVNLEVLKVSPYVLKEVPQLCLDPTPSSSLFLL